VKSRALHVVPAAVGGVGRVGVGGRWVHGDGGRQQGGAGIDRPAGVAMAAVDGAGRLPRSCVEAFDQMAALLSGFATQWRGQAQRLEQAAGAAREPARR
jgi:hypothetical protein